MKIDTPIAVLKGDSIEFALKKEYRQYLTGKLTREQKYLPHINDEIEIGISLYEEFTADKPHVHPIATEHGYVLQGAVRLKKVEDPVTEYEFRAGDFFVIQPGISYATKNAAGTKVLFIKSPGVNDKTLIKTDESLNYWLSRWDV